MAYEQKDFSGVLFRNDKRGDDERQPQAKGSAVVDGVEYWVSAWTNTAKESGEKYQKLSFKRKEAVAAPKAKREERQEEPPADIDVPF